MSLFRRLSNPLRAGNPEPETIREAARDAADAELLYGNDPPGTRDEYGERLMKVTNERGEQIGFAPATATITVLPLDRVRYPAHMMAKYRAFTLYTDDERVPHPSAVRAVMESWPGYTLSYAPAERRDEHLYPPSVRESAWR